MAPSFTLGILARVFRKRTPPPAALYAYAADVVPIVERSDRLYHEWFELTAEVGDSEKLANAAAIHRWEAATMARTLEGVPPPPELASEHGDLIETLQLSRRASQLLSSGSRYHNANAVCEGQMLLTEARQRRIKAIAPLRGFLASSPAAPPEASSSQEATTTLGSEAGVPADAPATTSEPGPRDPPAR